MAGTREPNPVPDGMAGGDGTDSSPRRAAGPRASTPGFARMFALASAYTLRGLVLLAGTVVLFKVLARMKLVVLPLVLALILATFLAPLVARLRRIGLRPALAAFTVLLPAIGVVAALAWFFGSQVVSHFDDVGVQVEDGLTRVEDWLRNGPLGLSPSEVDDVTSDAVSGLRGNWGVLTSGLFAGAVLAFELVAGLLLALVILFFFLKDSDRLTAFFVGLAPEHRREDVRALGSRAWTALSGFIRGAAINGLIEAVLVAVALAVLGVPLAIPLAGITFFAGFFPVVGAVFAGVVAALVALVAGGVGDAIVVAIVFTVVQQLQNNVLEPMILGRAVRLHPLVILVSLTAGAVLGGIIGAFLAVPIAAVAVAVVDEARERGLFATAAGAEEPPAL